MLRESFGGETYFTESSTDFPAHAATYGWKPMRKFIHGKHCLPDTFAAEKIPESLLSEFLPLVLLYRYPLPKEKTKKSRSVSRVLSRTVIYLHGALPRRCSHPCVQRPGKPDAPTVLLRIGFTAPPRYRGGG